MDDPEKILDQVKPALKHWGLPANNIKLASLSENIVYKVRGDDSRDYALRIHRPGYHTREELNAEQNWTMSLDQFGICVPTPCRTREGEFFVELECNGSRRQIGLIRWIDGINLGNSLDAMNRSTTEGKTTFKKTLFKRMAELGRICARMHNQACAWQPAETIVRQHLNVDGFFGDTPFWGRFWEIPQLSTAERETLLDARNKCVEILNRYGEHTRTYSMIHADLHPYNIIVSNDELFVIDFDDAGFGWHQYDLAVALYNYKDRKDFESLQQVMIEAYRKERDITEEALSLIPLFIIIRAMVHLGWLSARPELQDFSSLPQLIEHACGLTVGIDSY